MNHDENKPLEKHFKHMLAFNFACQTIDRLIEPIGTIPLQFFDKQFVQSSLYDYFIFSQASSKVQQQYHLIRQFVDTVH